jgi:hypothetical protein
MSIKSLRSGYKGISALAGNLPPGDFESISTVVVGSGGSSEINFTSIPSTYQHLQIRVLSRDNRAASANSVFYRLNTDTGSNYAYHILAGDGANTSAAAEASKAFTYGMIQTSASATSSMYTAGIIDILDYANTNKNTTIRTLQGYEANGSGHVRLNSGLWTKTPREAVNAIRIYPDGGASFIVNSHFALYGIRG